MTRITQATCLILCQKRSYFTGLDWRNQSRQVCRGADFSRVCSIDRSRVEGYDEGSDKENRDHEKRGERERRKKERKRGSKIVSRERCKALRRRRGRVEGRSERGEDRAKLENSRAQQQLKEWHVLRVRQPRNNCRKRELQLSLKMLQKAYGESTLSKTRAYEWSKTTSKSIKSQGYVDCFLRLSRCCALGIFARRSDGK
ncbi:hypothetical protein ALC57_01925 [Trachymyrmex cornetzi]|uniref:Uncharacterized protein n=1 Tax=Trachymyrmex cornetzi TaxID=471704 RepID=A0A195EL57_9HYME|nr:hypothetical protein ALC57_01925 [Trachymyrmex cornetzi]